jgi:ferritin-like metal-binding protein YciE
MTTLRETFIETLKDTYDAEHQIIMAFPKIIKSVENDHLRAAVETHLAETEQHAQRLEQVFKIVGAKAEGSKCHGMAGLITEGQGVMEEDEGEVATILALQKVEHYEIVTYTTLVSWAKLLTQTQSDKSPYTCGSLFSWAKLLDEQKASIILENTLVEEIAAHKKLTGIAQEIIDLNRHARLANSGSLCCK